MFSNNRRRQERHQLRIIWIIMILAILWIISRVAMAQDIPTWAMNDSRTQAGSWIWFPGKYTAVTVTEADMMAKGMAINYLMQECQLPHKEVRFNERHVEELDGKYRVYVRASITHRQCEESKYGSKELKSRIVNKRLLAIYRQYSLHIAETQIAQKICSADADYCLDLAIREFDLNNPYKAYIYAERACNRGIVQGCNSVKIIKRYLSSNNL